MLAAIAFRVLEDVVAFDLLLARVRHQHSLRLNGRLALMLRLGFYYGVDMSGYTIFPV